MLHILLYQAHPYCMYTYLYVRMCLCKPVILLSESFIQHLSMVLPIGVALVTKQNMNSQQRTLR